MSAFWTLRRRLFAWVSLAGLGLVYLAGLWYFPTFARPLGDDQLALRSGTPQPVLRSEHGAIESFTKILEEIRALSTRVERLDKLNAALGQRVAILEAALGPATGALPPDGPPATGALKRKEELAAPIPKVSVTYSPLPQDGFGDTQLNQSPLPIAGIRAPTRTLFAVELATTRSVDALRQRWVELRSSHETLLGKLEARQVESAETAAEGALKLVAGPFANAADAALLCARLRTAGAACKETVFLGAALPPD